MRVGTIAGMNSVVNIAPNSKTGPGLTSGFSGVHHVDNDPLNPDNQIGNILLKKYRLESILGEGSFAIVFSALDIETGEKVAVKCLYKTGLSSLQLALQREEVSIMERVSQHPNIVTLLDTCETFDHLYLILEYCEMDLFDGIMTVSGFAPFEAKRLFKELVDAVSSCHDVGIFHRDLKPENVLLVRDENGGLHARLADFGLATSDSVSTEFGCGSIRYMAPECLGDSQKNIAYLSSANDVWSLAIILINLLTGKNPWVEPNALDKHYAAHLLTSASFRTKNQPDSFRTQFGFSDGLCQVLRLAFAPCPSGRPSAKAFLSHILRIPSLFEAEKLPVVLTSQVSPPTSKNTQITPVSSHSTSFKAEKDVMKLKTKLVEMKSHYPPSPPDEEGISKVKKWKSNDSQFSKTTIGGNPGSLQYSDEHLIFEMDIF